MLGYGRPGTVLHVPTSCLTPLRSSRLWQQGGLRKSFLRYIVCNGFERETTAKGAPEKGVLLDTALLRISKSSPVHLTRHYPIYNDNFHHFHTADRDLVGRIQVTSVLPDFLFPTFSVTRPGAARDAPVTGAARHKPTGNASFESGAPSTGLPLAWGRSSAPQSVSPTEQENHFTN